MALAPGTHWNLRHLFPADGRETMTHHGDKYLSPLFSQQKLPKVANCGGHNWNVLSGLSGDADNFLYAFFSMSLMPTIFDHLYLPLATGIFLLAANEHTQSCMEL